MAHAYTPGLRVTHDAVLRRERRLPLKGRVLVSRGDALEASTVVARTELPGNVQTVNLAAKLALDPVRVPEALRVPVGQGVRQGEVIAEGRSLFGLVTQRALAPADGTVESVSPVTGQLILREPPIPVEVTAYVRGIASELLPDEGVVVETRGAFMQGIFGIGGETWGPIAVVARSPDEEMSREQLHADLLGKVVIGGAYVSHATLERARELGVSAVVVGGFDDRDLLELLGYDLGVAITGTEELGLTLIMTEGFGRIRMADRTWKLLTGLDGRLASVSGATQIRAGVMRPEIIIPHEETTAAPPHSSVATGVGVGSLLRVIRAPHFGRIGHVVELPTELQELETEANVRVMVVQFADDNSRAVVPRANVELIEE